MKTHEVLPLTAFAAASLGFTVWAAWAFASMDMPWTSVVAAAIAAGGFFALRSARPGADHRLARVSLVALVALGIGCTVTYALTAVTLLINFDRDPVLVQIAHYLFYADHDGSWYRVTAPIVAIAIAPFIARKLVSPGGRGAL